MIDKAVAEPLQIVPKSPKIPPQSLEAEQSLIGSLLLDNQKWDDVNSIVLVKDFYHQNHQIIFKAMQDLVDAGSPLDVVTVSDKLSSEDNLKKIGDMAYLATLAENTPGTANLITYARIIRDNSVLRSLIVSSNQISEQAYHTEGQTTRQILDHAEKMIFDISESHDSRRGEFAKIGELLPGVLDRIDELQESATGITGVATGYTRIDQLTSGFQKGDLIIIAGRPSMGKTSLAINIAEYVAFKQRLPVGIFSLEMSGQQLTMRLLSSLSGVNSNSIRTGRLSDNDWPRLNKAIETLQDLPIVIDESSGLNAHELRSRSRKMSTMVGGLGLIVVDYLQLMQGTEQTENRATEISGITRSMKLLAKELNVPIVVLSQLNRSIETRVEKRPRLSDLRESGAIEQDADLIMFIHKEESNESDSSDSKGTAEIIIGKQRNGPIDSVRLTFRSNCTRFENYIPEDAIDFGR